MRRRGLRQKPTPAAKLARLNVEIERYADAIGAGLSSPTVIERLRAAERERAELQTLGTAKRTRTDSVSRVIPNIEKLYEKAVGEVARLLRVADAESARENLRGYMGEVRMTPRPEGGLVAEARLDGNRAASKTSIKSTE
jgi:hypothetical protein